MTNNLYFCNANTNGNTNDMETITLTFNPNSPFAASMEAFLKTVPQDVKVSKSMKPKRKRRSNYQITLDTIREAREGKNLTHYKSFEEFKEKMHAL